MKTSTAVLLLAATGLLLVAVGVVEITQKDRRYVYLATPSRTA
ncbi:hypothetical protein ACFU90_03470 [Streptomyces noursei]|nr:hypothetical protein [Streptomyces noursei]